LAIRALKDIGMPYALYLESEEKRAKFEQLKIPFWDIEERSGNATLS
jgi:hypothetical protein